VCLPSSGPVPLKMLLLMQCGQIHKHAGHTLRPSSKRVEHCAGSGWLAAAQSMPTRQTAPTCGSSAGKQVGEGAHRQSSQAGQHWVGACGNTLSCVGRRCRHQFRKPCNALCCTDKAQVRLLCMHSLHRYEQYKAVTVHCRLYTPQHPWPLRLQL
jgi:hypothetical protein